MREQSGKPNATLTWEQTAERRKRGKIRVSVPRRRNGQTFEYIFRNEMTWWREVRCKVTSESLFTSVTWKLVQRVVKWIEAGEVCDPEPIDKMYINLGTEDAPKYICRRDTCKLEGSNSRDHEVFQCASTDPWKAHDRLLQDVVRRNHAKQIKFTGAPDFRHYNFKLVDKLRAYLTEMDMMTVEPDDAPIRRWSPPELVENSLLGMNALAEEQRNSLMAPVASPDEERICLGEGRPVGFDDKHTATLEAGRPDVPQAAAVEDDDPVVEDTARVEEEERIEDTARVEEEEEQCALQLSPVKQTKSPRGPKSPRGNKRNRPQSRPQSPEHIPTNIAATISAAKRAASREVNGESSEARRVSPRGSPEKLNKLVFMPSVESKQAVKIFWLLRADCVNKDGSTDFVDLAYRWNIYIDAHHGQACISGLPLVDARILGRFETKLCRRQKESQSLARVQVLSGEKMMGHQYRIFHGGAPSYGPMVRPYPHVPPQSIPSFHPPPCPPAWCKETKGVGKGGKGKVKTCRACANQGHPGVQATYKHMRLCAFTVMEKQKPKD